MPTLHAVLIGINTYPNCPLYGCVNDILAVHDYFKTLCAAKDNQGMKWNPKYLLAPNQHDEANIAIKEITYNSPTRAHVIEAFSHFKQAKEGDFCLLYYTGHGAHMPVPHEFEKIETDGQVETIVCWDSRLPGGRDLMDKELGYLIADALHDENTQKQKEGVHFLAIMDCCHSGSNTRGDEHEITARNAGVARALEPEEKILGFTTSGNCFYEKIAAPNSRQVQPSGIKHARYVNLAAARNNETAKEKSFDIFLGNNKTTVSERHGVFTFSLLSTLYQSGTAISYRDLIQRVEMEVRSRVNEQIPLLELSDMKDENAYFLKNEFKTPTPTYLVGFNPQTQEWYMNGGAINGIVLKGKEDPSTIKLNDGRVVQIKSVGTAQSILDRSLFTSEDRMNFKLTATIENMAFPSITVGYGESLSASMRTTVEETWATLDMNYVVLDPKAANPDYKIESLEGKYYILCKSGDKTPVFIRHDNAYVFLTDLQKVGKWSFVQKMSNPATDIKRDDIEVEIGILEGIKFNSDTLGTISDSEYRKIKDPETISVSRKNEAQPAIKVKITNKGQQVYYVGALYMAENFGINHKYLSSTAIGPGELKSEVSLKFVPGGREYPAIPLNVDKEYQKNGISEVVDYLILYIATDTFDLSRYAQEKLKMDITRSAEFEDESRSIKKDDWFTIKIPIHINRPLASQELVPNATQELAGVKIQSNSNLQGKVSITNMAAARRLQEGLETPRSTAPLKGILPPASLWEGTESGESIFRSTVANAPDQHLSILELTDLKGEVSKNDPLLVQLPDSLEKDESLLPFGYDKTSGLYIPLGYMDAAGNVRIERLPDATDGIISEANEETAGQRSLKSSVKLFFRKIVWSKLTGKHDYCDISLLTGENDAIRWYGSTRSNDTANLAAIRTAVVGKKVLLLVHGIIGDYDQEAPTVWRRNQQNPRFDAILTYNYENLNTPIEKSAEKLAEFLKAVGVGEGQCTILAQSMGGLVSRYMIEQVPDAAKLINCLVMTGVPNGGSEISDFRKRLASMATLAINGVSRFQPYITLFSFVGKGLGNAIFLTLNQMQPGSDFLKKLNAPNVQRNVPYYLVAGDTANIEANFNEKDSIFAKVWKSLHDRGKYIAADLLIFKNEPNDIAVRVESMKEVPGGITRIIPVICDHRSYYEAENLEVYFEELVV
jgi:pimeloyl-ACP methyl ester carboxylesterase